MENLNSIDDEQNLSIETIQGQQQNEVSLCPQRGGIITSLKLKGKEILYLDQSSFLDMNKNVKGGIPILFPNAGPVDQSQYSLKQHGFARTSDEWNLETMDNKNESIETFNANENTYKVFPYNFELRIKTKLENDGSVSLTQEAINLEKNKEMPLSMGLHPYFKVPHDKKQEIKFDFPGGAIVENDVELWSNDGTTSIDNPKIKDSNAVLRVTIPELGTLIIDVSSEYKKIWIWSLPGKDFICIEPVMRDEGGLTDAPELVKPNQIFSGKINFRLEE